VDTTSIVPPAATPELAGLSIYPNPVTTQVGFQLRGGYELSGKTIRIIHPNGAVVLQKKMNSNEEKMDVSALHQGVYLMIVGSGSDRRVVKLIKL
jgi:hypothetical protein